MMHWDSATMTCLYPIMENLQTSADPKEAVFLGMKITIDDDAIQKIKIFSFKGQLVRSITIRERPAHIDL